MVVISAYRGQMRRMRFHMRCVSSSQAPLARVLEVLPDRAPPCAKIDELSAWDSLAIGLPCLTLFS